MLRQRTNIKVCGYVNCKNTLEFICCTYRVVHNDCFFFTFFCFSSTIQVVYNTAVSVYYVAMLSANFVKCRSWTSTCWLSTWFFWSVELSQVIATLLWLAYHSTVKINIVRWRRCAFTRTSIHASYSLLGLIQSFNLYICPLFTHSKTKCLIFSRPYGRAIGTVLRLSSVCRLSSSSMALCIVAKRCVLEQKLLLTAYRKSYIRNRLVPKWMTLTFI